MGDTNTVIMIAATDAMDACKGKKTLKAKLLAAMRAVKDHWLLTNKDEQFIAAIGGVAEISSEDDKHQILTEAKFLKAITSALNGGGVVLPQPPDGFKPIGLIKMWCEVNEGKEESERHKPKTGATRSERSRKKAR